MLFFSSFFLSGFSSHQSGADLDDTSIILAASRITNNGNLLVTASRKVPRVSELSTPCTFRSALCVALLEVVQEFANGGPAFRPGRTSGPAILRAVADPVSAG